MRHTQMKTDDIYHSKPNGRRHNFDPSSNCLRDRQFTRKQRSGRSSTKLSGIYQVPLSSARVNEIVMFRLWEMKSIGWLLWNPLGICWNQTADVDGGDANKNLYSETGYCYIGSLRSQLFCPSHFEFAGFATPNCTFWDHNWTKIFPTKYIEK
jgi:hypothetical protein